MGEIKDVSTVETRALPLDGLFVVIISVSRDLRERDFSLAPRHADLLARRFPSRGVHHVMLHGDS
jgi:hypothetical protein